MKDWIRPLTVNLKEHYNIAISEDEVVSLIKKDDFKHTTKQKRNTKHSNNFLFKVRNYPNSIEVVKINNHSRLYLVGETLVVYAAAAAASAEVEEPEPEPEAEAEAEADEEIESDMHIPTPYGGFSGQVHGNVESWETVEQPTYNEGIPDPELVHGFTFDAKLVAIGSLINNNLVHLTDTDLDKCVELGIYSQMTGKLQRAQQLLTKIGTPTAADADADAGVKLTDSEDAMILAGTIPTVESQSCALPHQSALSHQNVCKRSISQSDSPADESYTQKRMCLNPNK